MNRFPLLLIVVVLLLGVGVKEMMAQDSSLFESDFENGILADFDGIEKWGGNSSVETTIFPVIQGNYSLRCQGGNGGWPRAIVYKTFAGAQQVYARVYAYFPELWMYTHSGVDWGWIYFLMLSYGHPPPIGEGGTPIFWAGFRVMYYRWLSDGPPGFYWTGYYYDALTKRTKYFPDPDQTIPTVTAGRWYCVEIMMKRESSPGVADGEYHIWINGNEIYTGEKYQALRHIQNNDNYSGPSIDTVFLGMFETPPSDSHTEPPRVVVLDSLKINDAYIGPEPGLDVTSPSFGPPSHEPEVVMPNQNVTVSVNVTDDLGGVREVILWYSTDNGNMWTNVTMSNVTKHTYIGEIPGFLDGTYVYYKIIASDNAGNVGINDNDGKYHIYQVIPESSTLSLLLVVLFLTGMFIVLKKTRIITA